MKTKILLSMLSLLLIVSAFSQKPTMELTFTAVDNANSLQLYGIKVMNLTQGVDTILSWPDTVLLLDYQTGISEISNDAERLKVTQNYPNPVIDQTTICVYVPEKDNVRIIVTDMLGRYILQSDKTLDKGIHSFRFMPGGGNLYFFNAQWRGMNSSIKILKAASNSSGAGSLEYIGSEVLTPMLKATEDIQNFEFSLGDLLLYIGYANDLQSGILDKPEESQTYTFQFATNIPCPGTPTVEYEGQVYNTIQIFSQCWLRENLNVGTMIQGNENMTDNGILEKYCYNNKSDSCAKYGGLYQWDEMMQYTTQPGTQGICPPGWYLPTDEEWKVLEGAVDSQYGIGDPEWDQVWPIERGYDVGTNLKTTGGWISGGNGTDLYGFSALPGGGRSSGYFVWVGTYGYWFSSTEYDNLVAMDRRINYDVPGVFRGGDQKYYGTSVRCVKDN